MERGEGIAASGCVSAKEQSQGRVRLVRKPLALKEQWAMGGRCHLRAVSTRGSSPSLQKAKLELLHFFQFFKKFIYLFIYLFLAVLGLGCCAQAFSICGEQGLLFMAVCRLLIAVASLVAEHGL